MKAPFKRRTEPAWILKNYHEMTTLNQPWALDLPLLRLSPFSEPFTLATAFRGVKIYGATGSGKSSGFGAVLGCAYLEHGFGGLVLCAKADNDELNHWLRLSKLTSRENSIIHFGIKNTEQEFSLNIIEFLRTLNGNKTDDFQLNIVTILKQITNNFRDQKVSSSDGFWDGVTEQYLTHLMTIALIKYHDTQITFEVLFSLFKALNNNTPFDELIPNFEQEIMAKNDLRLALHFFSEEFQSLNEKTRSIVITALSSMLFKFNVGILKKLFGSTGNITPKWIMNGAVIVVNMPTEEYCEVGKISNLLWKYAFQKAVQNRQKLNDEYRPIFLWADEVQDYIHMNDSKFQATARSKWCATVYLTQNIPGLRLALGGGYEAQDAIKALDSNLVNSVFNQNIDEETNKYASAILGLKKVQHKSKSTSGFFVQRTTTTITEKEEFRVKNDAFRLLKSGGKKNNFSVEFYASFPGLSLQYSFQESSNLDHRKYQVNQKNIYKYVVKNTSIYDVNFKEEIQKIFNK
ncbi:MAG: type IV secretory system conjugative DNA transfer family protein [Pseudobdellovibrio sp.]